MHYVSTVCVQPPPDCPIHPTSLQQAPIGDLQRVRQRCVGEGGGGGVRHHRRHVGHAVMNYSATHEGRPPVGGRSRGFGDTALIDGEVDDRRSWFHSRDQRR